MISERLGHATVAFAMQTYAHVIPGMDQTAANTVADVILTDTDGRTHGRHEDERLLTEGEEPADLLRFRSDDGGAARS